VLFFYSNNNYNSTQVKNIFNYTYNLVTVTVRKDERKKQITEIIQERII